MADLYDLTVPVFIKALENQHAFLKKGEAWCESNNVSKEDMINCSLAEDMKPLTFQITSASNAAKLCCVRVTGIENEPWDDNEKTFLELYARIEKTIAFLKKVDRKVFDGKAESEVVLKLPSVELKFTGLTFVQHFSVPNFFFHHTMAYAFLRAKGVPVGKWDYLSGSQRKEESA